MRTIAWIALACLALPLDAVTVAAEDDPAPAARSAEIDALVEALGHDDFRTRESASNKLAAHGEAARPALEEALRTSTSPEVRWRAEQLLRRLEGGRERPLGSGETAPRAGGSAEDELKDPMARIRRLIEDFQKRFGKSDPFDMPFGGPLTAQRRVQVPGLVLERVSPGSVQLRVKRKNESGAEVEDVFQGTSLKDILLRNPKLANHPGMEALQRKEAENSWPGFDEFLKRHMPHVRTAPGSGGTFSFSTSQGVSIKHDADGVTVTVTEKGEDGEPTTKEYKGESLDQLKKEHPELAEKLGGFRVQIRGPEFFWPGSKRSRLRPLPETRPTTPREEPADGPFGLTLTTPNEVLAIHLGLEEGKGALVIEVRPGSQAAELGLLPNDIIVKVGEATVDLAGAAAKLRAAGSRKAPVTIEIIRRGKTLTLGR